MSTSSFAIDRTSEAATTIAHAWANVERTLYDHFHEPDLQAARAFFAALAAHDLNGQPVWPMMVAPPGCGKTELINPMAAVPNVHRIDSITPNTFISGKAPEPGKPRGKEGLLERIGTNAVILVPDFSTILAMQRDRRDEVFSQLRCLYDGHLRKEFGIEGIANEWNGRLTFGAAVTPAIDRFTSVFGALGERFVQIRWKRVAGVEAAIIAMHQNHAAKDAAMRAAVCGLFNAMKEAPEPQIPSDLEYAIAATAELVACGRTPVKRERDDEVEHVPEPEGATRLAQQLCQVAKGSARLDGRGHVHDSDLAIVHRVAFDSLPPPRAAVVRAMAAGKTAESSGLRPTTLWRAVDDLKHLELLTEQKTLTDTTRDLFTQARLAA